MMHKWDDKNIIEQFEYPLPIIKADIDKISIETSGGFEGRFTILNAGGSELNGVITSNLRGLTFSPMNFSGNKVIITFKFNLDIYKKGDKIQTSALIMSNGGEIIIPVIINIIPAAVVTKDGQTIASLKDFLLYVKKSPVESGKLFLQPEFSAWLSSMNYEHMDMYEQFKSDPNRERAVDNFLVLNGLKNKAEVSIIEKRLHTKIKPNETEPVTGLIPLKIKGWGFLDERLEMEPPLDASWIKLLTTTVKSSDFDENGLFEASYIIYPSLINKKIAARRIRLVNTVGETAVIEVCKERELDVELTKQSYLNEDTGKIIVKNNTYKDLMLDVSTTDSFVKFEGKRYLVGGYAEIPFNIRMTALQSAQFALLKQPVIKTGITIKTYINDRAVIKTLEISIGNLYIE